MAQEKFDLRTAWKLFVQSKRIVDYLGLRELDAQPPSAASAAVPDERGEGRRLAFAQLMRIDCVFRAFYGKPPIFMHEPWSVHLPSVVINKAADPSAMGLATILVAFARLMLVIMESFRVMDDDNMRHRDIRSKLESYFWQAHTWVEEWQIVKTCFCFCLLLQKIIDNLIFLGRRLSQIQESVGETSLRRYTRLCFFLARRLGAKDAWFARFDSRRRS